MPLFLLDTANASWAVPKRQSAIRHPRSRRYRFLELEPLASCGLTVRTAWKSWIAVPSPKSWASEHEAVRDGLARLARGILDDADTRPAAAAPAAATVAPVPAAPTPGSEDAAHGDLQ